MAVSCRREPKTYESCIVFLVFLKLWLLLGGFPEAPGLKFFSRSVSTAAESV